MAAFLDICRFLPTAGGTTDWIYAAVVQGYQSLAAAGAINGRLYKYRAESADLAQWEVGEGAYNASTGTLARTSILFNSAGNTSKVNFSAAPQVAVVALKEDLLSVEEANGFTAAQQAQARANIAAAATPGNWTRTVLSSGSGTYTTKAGCKALLVRMCGGGSGGGPGGGSGAVASSTAGATTFGTSFLTANGGSGAGGAGSAGTVGGTASGGDINVWGGFGAASPGAGGSPAGMTQGGLGGSSYFGGGGYAGWAVSPGAQGSTGAGGGGGGANSTGGGGSGGAAGGYCEKLITSPAASYPYTVGAGSAGGAAGSGGAAGGVGGNGIIIIDEYY